MSNTPRIQTGIKFEYNNLVWQVLCVNRGNVSVKAVSSDGPKGTMHMSIMSLWNALDHKRAFLLSGASLS